MREWLHVRCRDREHRVRDARKLDALALGDHLEVRGVGVERQRLGFDDREVRLGVAAPYALPEATLGGLKRELDRVGPMGLCAKTDPLCPGITPASSRPSLMSSNSARADG